MALTSASSDEVVVAQYEDNIGAGLDGNTASASLAREAISIIRGRLPQSGAFAGRTFAMSALDKEWDLLSDNLAYLNTVAPRNQMARRPLLRRGSRQ